MSGKLQQAQRVAQSQRLAMTPQLTQSIKLLAMTNQELETFIDEQVESNPLVRKVLPVPSRPLGPVPTVDPLDGIGRPETLAEHLHLQIAQAAVAPPVALAARSIAADLDEAGRLPDPNGLRVQLAIPRSTFGEALRLVRSLEPHGVGARDLRDTLALQLIARDRFDPAMAAIVERLDLVAAADRSALQRVSGLDAEDLDDALAELRALDPRPGRRFAPSDVAPAPPDVLLHRDRRGAWIVELNAETLPRLVADRDYRATLATNLRKPAEQAYLADAWTTATWLERAVDQRARTVLKVAQAVVTAQDGFFERGSAALAPLTMSEIANRIGMHESTVSRVAAGKTIEGPRGVVALRSLFATALPAANGAAHASVAVRERIRLIVAAEGRDVLSDDAIVTRLKGDGVLIARRTVAKYREVLAIPSSTQRRRMSAVAGASPV